MSKFIARSILFMENVSFGSGICEIGRIVSPRATTASKTDLEPIVLAQSNIWTRFACYWPMTYIFYKNGLLLFWTFIRLQSNVFCVKNSRSGKSSANRFFIFWMMIKNWKGFDSQRSSSSSSSQNWDLSFRMYIQGRKRRFVMTIRDPRYRQIWILRCQLVCNRWSEWRKR
jgi:hypothetical protein